MNLSTETCGPFPEHELKTWPHYFTEVLTGRKTFECRKNDRNFAVGDLLILREYAPENDAHTGREIRVIVKYAMYGKAFGIEEGYCVMGFDAATTGATK